MKRAQKSLLSLPVNDWTEADWLDLYSAMEWAKARICQRHGINSGRAVGEGPKVDDDRARLDWLEAGTAEPRVTETFNLWRTSGKTFREAIDLARK